MIEDSKGFIWLAANKGLYRYDGKEFKNYTHPKKRGQSVFNLKFDKQNRLWCTNITGQFFYIENDKLHLFTDLAEDYNQREILYNFLFFDNQLVAGGSNIMLFINLKTKKHHQLKKTVAYNSLLVKNDTLFFECVKKRKFYLNYISKKSNLQVKTVDSIQQTSSPAYLSGNLFKIKNNLFFYNRSFITNQDIIRIKNDSLKFLESPKSLQARRINAYATIDDGNWFFTDKGVKVFTLDSTQTKLQLLNNYFDNKVISKVIKDKQENYWFSTLHNGVFIIPNLKLIQYQFLKKAGTILTLQQIDKNTIAYGTTNGFLGIYNSKTTKTDYVELPEKRKIDKILFHKKTNNIYISADNPTKSYIYNIENKKLTSLSKSNKTFVGAKALIHFNDSTLLYAFNGSIRFLKVKNNSIKKNELIKNNRRKRNYDVFFDSKKNDIYAAYVDHLIRYDKNFNTHKILYKNKPIFTRSITKTKNGVIWVSTHKHGVLGIENDSVTQVYATNNGLLSNQTSIVKADENFLWIITEKGIQKLDTKTKKIQQLTKQDGLTSYNITDLIINENTVYFSSNLGLFSFDKNTVFKQPHVYEPYFTSVAISDSIQPLQKKYLVNDEKIKISFNSNGFQSSENALYQYRLKGLKNEKWQMLTKGVNEVTYNSLPQGNYTFQLQSLQNNLKSDIKELTFNVKSAFYKQWWFIGLVALTGMLGLIFYYRRILSRQKEREKSQLEKQQNELEKTFLKLENLRSQMNPHFVFNALNSIQDYIITNEKDLASDYLGKFADLIRMYLDQSSKQKISLQEEIDTLNQYLELEKLRFEDKLNYYIKIDNVINTEEIEIPTMLIQPYVENALKHGLLHKREKGNLNISINKNETHLIFTITDDGIGRKKALEIKKKQFKTYKSFGTKATQNRIELLNYNKTEKIVVDIENLNNQHIHTGTKVMLKIPIHF